MVRRQTPLRYDACAMPAHPGSAGSGAVSVLGFWPGTRRTMMEVFFWMSSLSSFHSAVPCQKRTAQAGRHDWTIVGLELC